MLRWIIKDQASLTDFPPFAISAKVSNVRKFMRSAFGNHHVLVYGNHVKQAKALCHRLDIDSIEL